MLGRIIRRAMSSFSRTRSPMRRRRSSEEQLARGAIRTAKKKL
ncbi:hypothetical protein OCH239_16700 [Roseivivax halodurans JCM 10272]|uniref:Uncharacterized protein n=1 Tax=Roseivivax halodurans JCM 10272 TaxID=1449350 RepID=X7EI11_9RHOB|nr:hypothetical protein [Roseivivax halodurans]ETX15505.1 hypothetical protein OCH239_16700 [Roseivivax halodurans JCM 10272]